MRLKITCLYCGYSGLRYVGYGDYSNLRCENGNCTSRDLTVVEDKKDSGDVFGYNKDGKGEPNE